MSEELTGLDATAQAGLVRRGEVTSVELVDAAIARIEAIDPAINAVIHTRFDEARAEAAAVGAGDDAPFAGVPFLLKDIGATQAGLPYWMGNVALKAADHRLPGDTVLGARFRDAGFVTVGKANLPELGSTPTTQPRSCGPTANPWDLGRSPAGSSGGSAAAVASGMVPVAHANDGGGSTRLPAAWCGLVGLKTTRGRIPAPDTISRLLSELVVSRSVRDTAGVLDAVAGPTPADLFRAEPPGRLYVDELGAPVEQLRVGVLTTAGPLEVDADCAAAARAAAAWLEEQGHHVVEVDDEVLFGADSRVNGRLWMAGLTQRVDALGKLLGRPLTEDEVEPFNWAAAERGRSVTVTEWVDGQEAQQAWVASVLDWFADLDVLVTPTAGCPPLTTAELEPPAGRPWKIGRVHARIGAFTLPFNATGQPAISLPLGQTATGLPVGVQLVAGMGREDLLLRLAARFEEATPWADRRPAMA
ncbi:MAG: amidase [Actinomycetota bacterium]